MDGSYCDVTILYADDEIDMAEVIIALSGDDWLKFKKAPAYQALMNWLEEAEISCGPPQRVEPETERAEPAEGGESRHRYPVLRLIAPVVSSILTALLTMKLLGIF